MRRPPQRPHVRAGARYMRPLQRRAHQQQHRKNNSDIRTSHNLHSTFTIIFHLTHNRNSLIVTRYIRSRDLWIDREISSATQVNARQDRLQLKLGATIKTYKTLNTY